MRTIIIVSFLLLFAGCAGWEWEDEALYKDLSKTVALAHERPDFYDSYDFDYLHNYWSGGGDFSEHFVSDEALAQIEIEKRKFLQWKYQREILQQKQAEERERLERKQAERERIEFEIKRKKFIQSGDGTLRDKSAQQVKKLVDSWRDGLWRWQDSSKFFSVENFYKVFGEPKRKQFLSSRLESDSYYFLYNCKDGVVQIKVHAEQLDDNGIVFIKDLNIF